MAEPFITGRRYFYAQLSATEKDIYKGIYTGFKQRRTNFVVSMKPVNGQYPNNDQLNHILSAVIQDNPAMYYVDLANTLMYRDLRRPERLTMTYKEFFTPTQSAQIEQALRYRVDSILNMLYDHPKGYQQVCQLYRFLVEHVRFCDSGASNTLPQLEAHSIIGPLLNQSSVCAGLVKTFQLICHQIDIGCLHVIGEAKESKTATKWGRHSWNAVYLDGKFYHADPTFDSSYTKSYKRFSCPYFLIGDQKMLTDHRWDRSVLPIMIEDH